MEASRRGVVRVVMWSVPAVSLAAVAPAYAVSTPPTNNVCVPALIKKVTSGRVVTRQGSRSTVKIDFKRGNYRDVVVTFNGVPSVYTSGKGFVALSRVAGREIVVQIKSCGKVVWSGRVGHEC